MWMMKIFSRFFPQKGFEVVKNVNFTGNKMYRGGIKFDLWGIKILKNTDIP